MMTYSIYFKTATKYYEKTKLMVTLANEHMFNYEEGNTGTKVFVKNAKQVKARN